MGSTQHDLRQQMVSITISEGTGNSPMEHITIAISSTYASAATSKTTHIPVRSDASRASRQPLLIRLLKCFENRYCCGSHRQ